MKRQTTRNKHLIKKNSAKYLKVEAPRLPPSKKKSESDILADIADKKRRRYFTDETENAIVLYNNTESQTERNKIFSDLIERPFRKIAENIINTFKFSYFDDPIENVQQEVVSFMVEKIGQYDQSKGKAFSYFSIVAKNYLILTNNTNYKRFRIHDEIDSLDINRNFHTEFRESEKDLENKEFIRMLVAFWENNTTNFFKKRRDVQIANAVVEILRRVDSIENFNKKALYIMIREMTDCKTQQITKVINSMKRNYMDMVFQYQNKGIVKTDNIYSNRFFT